MSTSEQKTVTLDGRQFGGVGQSLTAIQDDYVNTQLRRADTEPIILRIRKGEDPEVCSQELLTNILARGLKYRILAGVLAEDGKKWTIEEAERNAERFSQITDLAEKELMQTEVVGFVLAFFLYAIRSARTSPNSSSPHGAENPGATAGVANSATSA